MDFTAFTAADPKALFAVLWVLSLGVLMMSFQMFSRSGPSTRPLQPRVTPAKPAKPKAAAKPEPVLVEPETVEPVPMARQVLFAGIHAAAEIKAAGNPDYVPSVAECLARAGAWVEATFGPDGEGLLAQMPHWDAFEFEEIARVAHRLRMPDQAELMLRGPELLNLYIEAGEMELSETDPVFVSLCADIEALEVEFLATGGAQRFTRVLDENLALAAPLAA